MPESLTLEHIVAHRVPLLAELNRRQGVVRDYVRGVARQYATGLYLFGRPGTAKTHTLRGVLEQEIGEPYCYQRGHLTPVGLFELLADHPDEVVVLDDLVTIFKSDVALQILLSALEHPGPGDRTRTRIVRYRRKGEEVRVAFRGGVICVSNRELHDDELLGAFKSRVHTLNYDPSDAQLGASCWRSPGAAGPPPGRPSRQASAWRLPASSSARCCGWGAGSTCGCSSTRRFPTTSSGRTTRRNPTGATW